MMYSRNGLNLCPRCYENPCGGFYIRSFDGKAHLKICEDCSEEIFGERNTNKLDKDLDMDGGDDYV